MAVFYYKAKNKNAVTVSGQIDADSKEEAVEQVNQLGLLPISIEGQEASGKSRMRNFAARRPSANDLYLFTRQLYNLIRSGIPILRALELLALRQKNRSFREVIESTRLAVQQGRSLSEGLAQYPQIFPALYLAMIKAGEESGNLKDILLSLAEYQKGQQEIRSKVRTALAYPLVMLLFGMVTVFFILTYVLPQITQLFDNLEQSLPLPTVIVIQISACLTNGRMLFGLALLGLFATWGVQNFLKTKKGQLFVGRLGLKAPGVGAFFLKVDLARFSRTLELLIKSGIPIVKAIRLAVPVVSNALVREDLVRCHDDLVAGKSFGQSLQHSKIVPDIVGYLVAVGEESGSLGQTLTDVAENYEQEIEETLKVLMTLLEPLMIIFVGGIVGFIILAMLLPIFQMDIFAR